MSTNTDLPTKQYRSRRAVAQRYGRSTRTITRWRELGIIPPADLVINGHELWLDETLDAADAQRKAEATAA
jgi:hypothetical protein